MKKILCLVLALCVMLISCAFAYENTGVETTGTNYLCDERTTLTVCTYDGVSAAFKPISNDLRFWQWMEEYTNVHIEWQVHSNADYETVKTSKMASGSLDTDIINIGSVANAYTMAQAGMVAELSLDWMPYTVAYCETENQNIITNHTCADGKIYCIGGDVSPNMGHICYMYNTDWLAKVGWDVNDLPSTLDEFHDLCVKFQEYGDLNGNGEDDEIILTGSGMSMTNLFGNSFGLTMYEDNRYFNVDDEGKVYCEFVSDGMKELCTLMNQYYEEGILDEGIANTSADDMSAKIANDQVGIFIYYSAFSVSYGQLCTIGQEHKDDPQYCTYAMGEALEGPRGDKFYTMRISGSNDNCAVNANSENIELACRWLDVLTCDPVAMKVRTTGWEGEHYTIDEDGNTQLIYDENGSWTKVDSDLGTGQIAMPHYQNYDQLMNSKLNIEWYCEQYNTNILTNSNWVYPDVPLINAYTEEEQELLDMSSADCTSYFKEMRAKFITGEEDIETGWDAYVENMYALGLEDYIAAEQSIYDRTR